MPEIFGSITQEVLLTYTGAMCGHILSLYNPDFKGAVPFFKQMFPNKSETFYFRMDFLILPILGALLASILLEPATAKSAIFAGLSWSGTLTAILLKKKQESNNV